MALDLSERIAVAGSRELAAYALVRVAGDEVVVHVHDFHDEMYGFDL